MARTRNDLLVELTSDGTAESSRVTLNGRQLRNVQAIDLRIDRDGVRCIVTVGETAVDYGPATVRVTNAPAHLRPGPTPRA
jgi:hypothetical protein